MNSQAPQYCRMDQTKKVAPVQFAVIGEWAPQSAYLQNLYPNLTAKDVEYLPGREFELIGSIRSRLNKTFDEVVQMIGEAAIAVK